MLLLNQDREFKYITLSWRVPSAIGLSTPKVDYHLTRHMLMGQILKGATDYPLRPRIVAGIILNVPSIVFSTKGTVIDFITYLPESLHIALPTAFKQSMAKYPLAVAQEKLDTCYNVKGIIRICLPNIVFHFASGTGVSLNPSGIVWIPRKNPYVWCLGFAANEKSDDLTIIGNIQQRELDILYNIDAGQIGFGTKPCGS
ncbi:hypothetical protein ACH5RR_033921 [Cinchona calisaya]|uniref:Xylanase inhibitor C-terminal domain-containing protein n=1 Tax=Cinchona calisaya TaxID=153742 RepID=A0ABD2YA99_9GENT